MLIACERCHRQYDVGALETGKKVRCYCGELNVVPEQQARDMEMLHCGACGGDVRRGSKACEYCGSELSLAEKGIGDACPTCYGRLVKGAKFCSSCGTAIKPQAIRKSSTDMDCPRCQAPLSECEIPGGAFTECTGCGGIWLAEQVFHEVTSSHEQSSIARFFPGKGSDVTPARKRSTEKLVKYLACPECGDMMNRKNFATCSGVIIDWCKGHGYWFDTDELELIVGFIQEGGLEKSRRRQVEAQKHDARMATKRQRAARSGTGRMSPTPMPGGGGGGFDDFGGSFGHGSILDVLARIVGTLLR